MKLAVKSARVAAPPVVKNIKDKNYSLNVNNTNEDNYEENF